jgi:hypothetical protein
MILLRFSARRSAESIADDNDVATDEPRNFGGTLNALNSLFDGERLK